MLTDLFEGFIEEIENVGIDEEFITKIYNLQEDCELILEREKNDSYQAGYLAGKHYKDSNFNY